MKRIEIIGRIVDLGIIAVVRAETEIQGVKIVDAIKKGGIKAIEITMTVPGALDIIKSLTDTYKDEDVMIGAGTVLDPETAMACMLAGAEYIVSPNLNIETLKLCNRYRVPSIPGVMTVNEAIEAMEHGSEIVKLFPGSAFGPSIIKAFRGPLPHANFMPTGGVDIDNVKDWFEAGAVAVATGSNLTKGGASGNYDLISETAGKFVSEVYKCKFGVK